MDPSVAGLVYIAARAPDIGEDHAALAVKFPTPAANSGLVFHDRFGALTEEAFLNDFANGIDPARARTLYAVQGRVSDTLFTDRTSEAAWRSKPSWYAVSMPGSHDLSGVTAFPCSPDAGQDLRDRLWPPLNDQPPTADLATDKWTPPSPPANVTPFGIGLSAN